MTRRGGRLVLVAATATAAIGALALLIRDDRDHARISFREPVAVEIPVKAGSTEQRSELRAILSRMAPIGLSAVELRPARKHWRPFPPGAVELRATTRGRDDVRGAWEANLLAGALQEHRLQAKLPPVVALMTNEGGGRLIGPSWPPRGTGAALTRPAAEKLARRLAEAAEKRGASGTAIAVVRPRGFAFAVTVRARNPARFLVDATGELLRLGGPLGASAGTYLDVRDGAGRFAAAIAIASSRGVLTHGSRARPDLVGCLGRSASARRPPPPCPAD